MQDHDDDVRQLARYGSGVARLYLWFWICVCYVWAVLGSIIGLLIISNGSAVFGSLVVGVAFLAWKVAGRLKRFKDGG